MGEKIVKNYPSPRLMETIGATNQTTAEAIGELVANCFDARYNNEKLEVIIDLRDNAIAVIDNGKGMTLDVLERAVCIGEDMSRFLERGEGAKGHFGMGFKTSCSTLGWFYEIYTRPADKNVEFHVEFDINDYSRRMSGSDAWDIRIEDSFPTAKSLLGERPHGTSFIIKQLKNPNTVISAIKTYMGKAFKPHLESGDKIKIIDETGEEYASPAPYSIIQNSKIEIDEVFGDNEKYHVKGWMALDKQTHNDGLYGFNIYRHEQLVATNDKTWFRAHLMTSRIIGEVSMDFVDATFYKQGIQQSRDWKIVKEHMENYLRPMVSASNYISKKGNANKNSEIRKMVNKLHEDYNLEVPYSKNDLDEENKSRGNNEQEKPTSINDTIKKYATEESLFLDNGREILIRFMEREGLSNTNVPFDYVFDEGDDEDDEISELQVIVYKDHPLWEKKIDDKVRRIIATQDSIYRMLVERLSDQIKNTSQAVKIRNEWVMKVLEINKGNENGQV